MDKASFACLGHELKRVATESRKYSLPRTNDLLSLVEKISSKTIGRHNSTPTVLLELPFHPCQSKTKRHKKHSQEDQEFEVSLGYIVSLRANRAMQQDTGP